MKKINNYKKIYRIKSSTGFTLLISIVTTAILLFVSFVVINVALKQLILAYSGRESQYAFYNAESGIECALFWDFKNGQISAFDPSLPVATTTASCLNQGFSSGAAPTTNFTINFSKGCVKVLVDKSVVNFTQIDSRGYNTCDAGAARKFERGIKIRY